MTPISLLDFLRLGAFGPCTPTAHCTPEDVFLALGAPEEAYAPGDLDRAYVAGDARCFPLIVAYGDVEFHFAAPTELTTLFVDSLPARRARRRTAETRRSRPIARGHIPGAVRGGSGGAGHRHPLDPAVFTALCLRGADRGRRGSGIRA